MWYQHIGWKQHDNPIDTCYKMIINLYELNLL